MALQFDMFSDDNGERPPKRGRAVPSIRQAPVELTEAGMVQHLTETGRYRILMKLEPRAVAEFVRPEFPLRGMILDTETTGLDHRKDEIIEIGAIAFTFDQAGNIGDVIGLYGGLQQPSIPIPAEITKLTGITDAMVAGQIIDIAALRNLIDPADLVIAHNAGFDRPFCEAFAPIFAWAGLWRVSDEWGPVYSGVMTDANEAVRPVHNRMPVLIHRHEYDQWLNGSFEDALAFQLGIFPPEFIEMEKTSELWFKRKTTEPETATLL